MSNWCFLWLLLLLVCVCKAVMYEDELECVPDIHLIVRAHPDVTTTIFEQTALGVWCLNRTMIFANVSAELDEGEHTCVSKTGESMNFRLKVWQATPEWKRIVANRRDIMSERQAKFKDWGTPFSSKPRCDVNKH